MSKGDKRDLGFDSDSSTSDSCQIAPKRKQRRSKPLLLPLVSSEGEPHQRRTKEAEQLSFDDDYMHMKLPDDHGKSGVPLFGSKQDEITEGDDEIANALPKGFNIMKKLGYQSGKKLGASSNASSGLHEPLELRGQTDRQGLRERLHASGDVFKFKVGGDDYREWRTGEDSKRQKERDLQNMQKLAFEMSGDVDRVTKDSDPRQFNVLWRRYMITLRKKYTMYSTNEESREDQDLYENGYEGGDEQGLSDGRSDEASAVLPNLVLSETKPDLESPTSTDEELRMFEDLSVDERIAMLHNLLRVEMRYCYYCGSKYADDQDLYVHCPGFQKEDHL